MAPDWRGCGGRLVTAELDLDACIARGWTALSSGLMLPIRSGG